MNKEQQKDEIILMVKNAIAANSIPFEDSDELVELDGSDVDNIAEEVAEEVYNAGYRKVPEYAVIIPAEEREEEIKATNEILAERDRLKAEIERLKAEIKYKTEVIRNAVKINEVGEKELVKIRKQTAKDIADWLTYRAEYCGGATRNATLAYADLIRRNYGVEVQND